MKTNYALAVTVIAASAILGGCAGPGYYGSAPAQSWPEPAPQSYPQTYPSHPSSQSYSSSYGVVDSIRVSQANSGSGGIGAGAVVGGVVGGLLGNQVGGGRGKKAATVAGVVGGAIVGNQIEQRNNAPSRDVYQVGIRLDNGSYRTVNQDSVADLQVGNRVRIENDRAYRY